MVIELIYPSVSLGLPIWYWPVMGLLFMFIATVIVTSCERNEP